MKITVNPGASEIVIGDDDAGDYVRDYGTDRAAKLEEIHFFGADYPLVIDNGGGARSRGWIVEREHTDAATAFEFGETHADDLPRTGTLEVIDDSGGGYTCAAARKTAKLLRREGRTTVFQYEFLCQVATAI